MKQFIPELEDRFTRYVKIDTCSDENSPTAPSTAKQYDMLNLLADELREIGAEEVRVTDYGCVLATVPATTDKEVPTLAFLGHVDTSPDFSGTDVKPIVHRNYDGTPIVLPDDTSQIIDPAAFPYLASRKGHDIVTASGTTLLGADDKAGCTIVMVMAHHLLKNKELEHGRIRLCFTPDEEVGRGVANLTLEDLDADFAYTLDGGVLGEIVYETFSADKATIDITGVSIHPGYAKGKMVSAIHLAAKLIDQLPQEDGNPATTSGTDGFIHVYKVAGTTASAKVELILRDFEREGLAEKGQFMHDLAAKIQASEPRATITCEITEQYRNMRYWLEDDMRPIDLATQVAHDMGIEPISKPIRGGTDGSRLTEMGLPTPNLFTGMQNFHGPLEWISLQDMAAATELCVRLVQAWVA